MRPLVSIDHTVGNLILRQRGGAPIEVVADAASDGATDAGSDVPADVRVDVTCPLGAARCGVECVDLTSDTRHFGRCIAACTGALVCANGTCTTMCGSGSTLCAGQCVTLGDDLNHCGACSRACATGETCSSGACVPRATINAVGCADGMRDAFIDAARFPRIAGCAGAWSLPGILPAIPASTLAACATLGDNSTMSDGAGCASSNLCARGWHICSGGEISPRAPAGCESTADLPRDDLLRGGGVGHRLQRLRALDGDRDGQPVQPHEVHRRLHRQRRPQQRLLRLRSYGNTAAGMCDDFDRASGDHCEGRPGTWSCNGGTMESRTVTRSGSARGGVLCCRD